MKFSIKYFFSKCEQISSFLRICSHLLKKSYMKNFIFCAVGVTALRNVNFLRHEGQRRDQEPCKHLRWRALFLAINCCCKALRLRCLHGYWLRPQRLIRHQCRESKNYGSSPFSRQIAEFLKAIMNFWLLLQTTPMAASVLIKMA